MAGKISDLPAATYVDAADQVELLQATLNKRVTKSLWRGEDITALTPAAGVVTIDCRLSDFFTLAPTANVTSILFTNLPGAGKAKRIFILFTQDTTARTVTFPASFKWPAATPQVVSTGSGAKDRIELVTFDNGTIWHAQIVKAIA